MRPLEPPDSNHVEAAQGWLELGNHLEVNEELERVKHAATKSPSGPLMD